MPKVWALCFASVAVLGAPRLAEAQASAPQRVFEVSVEYVAPSTCPSADDFDAVVVGRLGFDPFSKDAPRRVHVLIAENEGALEGRLEWRDPAGKWAGDQTFPVRHADCARLARTMGFALAVQINLLATGDAAAGPVEPARDESAPSEKKAVPPPARPAAPAPAADSKVRDEQQVSEEPSGARWAFALGAGASVGVGLASSATALGRVFGSVAHGRASLELGGEVGTRSTTHREDGAGFTQQAWLVTVAGCGTVEPWSGCVLAKGGVISVAGRGVDVPAEPAGSALEVGVRLGGRARVLGGMFLAPRLEGLVNLVRWTVTLDGLPVWRAPAVAGTLGLDVGVIFQ